MNTNISRLIKTVRKGVDWVYFSLPDGNEIKILIKDAKISGKSNAKVVIDCPLDIKISSSVADGRGNS